MGKTKKYKAGDLVLVTRKSAILEAPHNLLEFIPTAKARKFGGQLFNLKLYCKRYTKSLKRHGLSKTAIQSIANKAINNA